MNWQPVGQLMTITKVDKKRLYEINGIPASDVYRKYLGDKVGGNLPYSATEFPLLKIADDGTEVCRTFVDLFDDGSLLMTGNLEVGDRVRLAFGNVDLITRNTSKKAMEYREHQPEVVFVYNCASRKSFLQSRVMSEIEPLAEIAPVCGFFTYGEFFSHNNKSALLNITLTILGLREKERADIEPLVVPQSTKDELEKNTFSNKSFLVLEALTALSTKVIEELNQANKELEETKEKLEQLASTDKLTGVFNRSRLDYFLRHQMDECRRYNKTFGFAILDVDHFKRINDNHGHLVGDIALKEIATLIKTSIRCSDIFGRWGGEEFVLILPQATSEAMKGLLEKIRVMISRYPIDKAGPQTISIGATQFQPEDTVDQIIKRADDALYEAKNKGRNRVFIR
ncbi:MAG: hypothetical protein CSA52_03080 [Gammaproteobacteria bacterium]|nr:MAG: hypothetical protein CSA52_03080 [Gammaproteobacteria bacterium]